MEWNQESNKHQTSEGLNPHLTGSTRIQNKRGEEWNPHSFDQLVMEQTKVGRKETRSHDPDPLVGHHDRATKLAQGYP
jgi:hypothetical protein